MNLVIYPANITIKIGKAHTTMLSGSLVPKYSPQPLHLPNGTKPASDISKHSQELNVDPDCGQKKETVSAGEQPS